MRPLSNRGLSYFSKTTFRLSLLHRQLQDRRALAHEKAGEQDNFSWREFERIMVDALPIFVHPTKSCYLRAQPSLKYQRVRFNLALKREFCSGLDADGQAWLAYCAEAGRVHSAELRCDKLVTDLGRSRGQVLKAKVAHREPPRGLRETEMTGRH
jgi:hypothetical protein